MPKLNEDPRFKARCCCFVGVFSLYAISIICLIGSLACLGLGAMHMYRKGAMTGNIVQMCSSGALLISALFLSWAAYQRLRIIIWISSFFMALTCVLIGFFFYDLINKFCEQTLEERKDDIPAFVCYLILFFFELCLLLYFLFVMIRAQAHLDEI